MGQDRQLELRDELVTAMYFEGQEDRHLPARREREERQVRQVEAALQVRHTDRQVAQVLLLA